MIIHYKEDISDYHLEFQRELQYTSEYSFIPLKIKADNDKASEYDTHLFQTPLLFSPYGIQTQDNKKRTIDLSFMNKSNDANLAHFLKSLQTIYKIVHKKYNKKYRVNTFLKDTIFNECLRIKVNRELMIYDQNKNHLSDISSFSYGWFLINLHGLWRSDKELWFQWYLVQAKIVEPLRVQEYLFLDDDEHLKYEDEKDPINDKYSKMLKMGVPQEAIDLQRTIDLQNRAVAPKQGIPAPPPPPFLSKRSNPITKSSIPKKITADDLKQVVLKKSDKTKERDVKSTIRGSNDQMGFFEPPSLDVIQAMLQNLKPIK